jgi:hypothetical protein
MKACMAKNHERRFIFEGWDNYTSFEKEYIIKVKEALMEQYGNDMTVLKDFGPRMPESVVT